MKTRGHRSYLSAALLLFLVAAHGSAATDAEQSERSGPGTSDPRPTPPPGSIDPFTGGAVDSTAWVRLPADSLEAASSVASDSAAAPQADSASVGAVAPIDTLPAALRFPTPSNTALLPFERADAPQVPAPLAGGIYGGYPGWAGAMIVAPADGPAAFRSGVAGLPGVGILWTPGVEIRLNQAPGLYASDGLFLFGNLFLGRTWLEEERDYTGLESGLGYRWILTDRRGLRWIAAIETGGYWRPESAWPYRPCLRAYWLLVD